MHAPEEHQYAAVEGIENAEQAARLREVGGELGQGTTP
jgi:EAL domain-containing protein (putative c-di-GMP-specific phosphodiesterase class I)